MHSIVVAHFFARGHTHNIILPQHDTIIPRLIYPAPLEPGSQAAVGLTSTAMGDLAGISGAVSFCWLQPCMRARERCVMAQALIILHTSN